MSDARTLPSTGRRVVGVRPLKLAWWLGHVAALLVVATPAVADVTLVMVRHGEKPDLGLGQLSCQGLNRALALPDVLVAKFGRPDALFAPDPGVHPDVGHDYNYIRPLATIEPTAIRLGLPVDTRFGLEQEARLEDELLDRRHDGQLLVVAWEHNLLVQMARDLVARRGGDAKLVPDWPRDDFDSIFVLSVPRSGKPTLRIDHEGLDGQSPICPAAGRRPVPHNGRSSMSAWSTPRSATSGAEQPSRLRRRHPRTPWFAVDEGDAPLLVTAPHVTRPFREGAYRFEDGGGTGALARALHRLTGASAAVHRRCQPIGSELLRRQRIQANRGTADRPASGPSSCSTSMPAISTGPYEVDLGTMNGASLLGQTEWLTAPGRRPARRRSHEFVARLFRGCQAAEPDQVRLHARRAGDSARDQFDLAASVGGASWRRTASRSCWRRSSASRSRSRRPRQRRAP